MTKTYGPYQSFTKAGNLVFTAGQVGVSDAKAPESIEEQTKLALKNLGAVLESSGSSLSNVLKVNVYLTDMSNFETMNKVYAEVFNKAKCRPARTTVGVKQLPNVADNELLIEIDAIAELSPKEQNE